MRDPLLKAPVYTPVLLVLLLVGSLLISCSTGPMVSSAHIDLPAEPDQGCTILYAADANVILGGNNEDYINPYTYVWFVPPEPGKYGRVYFGYEDGFPQGGVNEAGLFFDGAALSYKPLRRPDDHPVYDGVIPRGNLFDKIMSEAATVAEALAIFDSYSRVGMDTYQLLLGDARGDSMIVDGDTVLPSNGPFQLATNFRMVENPDPPYPSQRFRTALDLLTNAESFSVELVRQVLDATHQAPPGPTLYSNIYDLKNGLIYVYHFHDFENVVVIDVAAELAKGFHFHRLGSLFPTNTEAANFELQHATASGTPTADRIIPIRPDRLTEYSGEYRVGSMGDTVSIYLEEGRLLFRQRFSLPIELLPEADEQFFHVFHDGNEMELSFHRDRQGAIASATGVLFGEAFQLEPVEPQPTALPTTR